MTPRKIVTRYVCPPIPWRHFDWEAYRDGDEGEENAPRGFGPNEQEAIDDLFEQERELADEPLL